ncbi:MAG: hypothetical protein Q9N34_02055 [Aquificota bacterium]|nr:hypothetical protein [Aquificota bacterium]
MKKEEKITNAVRSLLLVSEVLDRLGMPFSIEVFNDNVYELKGFEEDYRLAKAKIMAGRLLSGSWVERTDTQGELSSIGLENLELYTKKMGKKGILIPLFTDGEPPRGLSGVKGSRSFILQMKQKFPIVGVGVGEATKMVEYFDRTGISPLDDRIRATSCLFLLHN